VREQIPPSAAIIAHFPWTLSLATLSHAASSSECLPDHLIGRGMPPLEFQQPSRHRPELKRIAFQKVLDVLLGSGVGPTSVRKNTRTARSGKGAKTQKRGPRAYIREMIQDGFFKKPKAISEVKAELENHGHHIPLTSLSGPMQQLCKDKELRRQKSGNVGNKKTFSYSNW
jgi:hypothetical protein